MNSPLQHLRSVLQTGISPFNSPLASASSARMLCPTSQKIAEWEHEMAGGNRQATEVLRDAVIRAHRELQARTPLVQCITNVVSSNFMANILLAAGASPAMV